MSASSSRTRVPVLKPSVRPKSAKLPWGTIVQTEYGLGYQRLTGYEISQSVQRLYYIPMRGDSANSRYRRYDRKLNQTDLTDLLDRLTNKKNYRGPADANRTLSASRYRDMGVLSSFAWRGYN